MVGEGATDSLHPRRVLFSEIPSLVETRLVEKKMSNAPMFPLFHDLVEVSRNDRLVLLELHHCCRLLWFEVRKMAAIRQTDAAMVVQMGLRFIAGSLTTAFASSFCRPRRWKGMRVPKVIFSEQVFEPYRRW